MQQAMESILKNLKFRQPFQRLRDPWGAGVRWTPLPKAEAPTEPAGETQSPWSRSAERKILSVRIARAGGESKNSPVDCFLRGDALRKRASPCSGAQITSLTAARQ